MAAILDEDHSIDLDAMYKDLIKVLPAYARPLFIRLLQKVDTTGREYRAMVKHQPSFLYV